MAKTSKLKVSTSDAFALGKIEGLKEAFSEILEVTSSNELKIYLKARLKSLNSGSKLNNPFKQKA